MTDHQPSTDDFVVYCSACSRPLTEDDDIHFTVGPFGFDLDVLCGLCSGRSQAPGIGATSTGGLLGGIGAGLGGGMAAGWGPGLASGGAGLGAGLGGFDVGFGGALDLGGDLLGLGELFLDDEDTRQDPQDDPPAD